MANEPNEISRFLKATPRAPLSVILARQLREAIVSGQLAQGTAMPSEKELSLEAGVSRATVRESLRILQAQGLLSGGDTVSTQRPRVSSEHLLGSASQAMENVLRLEQVSLADLVEFRVHVEGGAVCQAAQVREPASLAQAKAALDIMYQSKVTIDAFQTADLQFHTSLAAASGNAAYPLMMEMLRSAILGHLGKALTLMHSPKLSMRQLAYEHEAIYQAVVEGEGDLAKHLIADHIRRFYRETAP